MIRGRGRGRGRKEGGREEEGREKAEEREREAAQTVTDRVTRAPHSRSGLCSLSPPAPLFPVSRDPWDIKRRRRRLRDSPRDCSHCLRCCWDALTHCRHPIISTRLASRPSLRLSLSLSLYPHLCFLFRSSTLLLSSRYLLPHMLFAPLVASSLAVRLTRVDESRRTDARREEVAKSVRKMMTGKRS